MPLHLDQDNFGLALSDYQSAIALNLNPDDASAHIALGEVYSQKDDSAASRNYVQKAQQLFLSQGNTALAEQLTNLLYPGTLGLALRIVEKQSKDTAVFNWIDYAFD